MVRRALSEQKRLQVHDTARRHSKNCVYQCTVHVWSSSWRGINMIKSKHYQYPLGLTYVPVVFYRRTLPNWGRFV